MDAATLSRLIRDHLNEQASLDEVLWGMAGLVSKHLPRMASGEPEPETWSNHGHTLTRLKRQLKQYNSTTGKWKR